jgi:hypothetical protein
MRYTPLDLLGGSNVDDNVAWSREDTINYIPQKASSSGARTEHEFRDAPGLKPFVMGPTGAGPVRGSHDCEGKHFVVMGSTFYQITTAGVAIPIGTIPGTQRVNIAHNQIVGGNEVIISTGTPNGYVYNTVTQVFGRITDPGYPGGGSVDYIDTYLVSVEPYGRYWFWSDQANATSYNTLNRTEAESDPDSIVGLAVNSFEVVVFGQNTVEFFYNAGGINGSTFRSKKVMNNHGCAARDSIVKLDNSLFWLGVDGILYRLNGYQAMPISSPQFTQRIAGLNWAKAFAFAYEDQGHVIYYITFPDGQTFGYDVTTGLMVRRESYGLNRWRLNTLTKVGRKWIGGDFQSGLLYEVDWNYPMEGEGTPLVRERIGGCVANNQNKIEVPLVELLFQTGTQEVDPVMFSDQPEGPTITGDAPDSQAGAAYTYTYTVTSGDAPIVRTVIFSGSLPPGASWDEATATITGPLTTPGSYSFTVQAIDENGLSATVTDTIEVGVVLMGIGSTAISTYRTVFSSEGDVWAITAADPGFSAGLLCPVSGTRFVAFNGTGGAVSYTDNFGVTWVPSTGTFAGGACPGSDARNGVVLIGAKTAEKVYRSTDSGVSFAPITTTNYWPNMPLFLTNNDVLLREDKTRNYLISTDAFATFSVGMVSDIAISARNVGFVHNGVGVFLGRSSAIAKPAIAKSTTGASETVFAFTDTVANHISAGCTNGSVSSPMWVVGTSDGELYWSDDLGVSWTKSTYVTPSGVAVSALCWNGVRFVAGTGVNLVQLTALVLNSDLGKDNWDAVTNPLAADVFDIACLQLVSA